MRIKNFVIQIELNIFFYFYKAMLTGKLAYTKRHKMRNIYLLINHKRKQ